MVLTPLAGSYVDIYYGDSAVTPSDYSNEAMEAVTQPGYSARQVFRITDATKRIMHDSTVPTFDLGGVPFTPTEVWYGAGYIYCATPLAAGAVRCLTGKYLAPTRLFGCVARSVNEKVAMVDITCYGDTSVARYPTLKDWDGKLDAFVAKLCAELQTIGGNANSHFILRDRTGGTAGNAKSITITQSTTLTVTLNTHDVAVTLATGGNTANEVINAINAAATVLADGMMAYPLPGETGTGLIAVLSHQHLNETTAGATGTAGRDAIDFETLKGTRLVMRWYQKYADGIMQVGYGIFDSLDWAGGPADLLKCSINVSGGQYPLRQVSNA
jgi:hypothetical protein